MRARAPTQFVAQLIWENAWPHSIAIHKACRVQVASPVPALLKSTVLLRPITLPSMAMAFFAMPCSNSPSARDWHGQWQRAISRWFARQWPNLLHCLCRPCPRSFVVDKSVVGQERPAAGCHEGIAHLKSSLQAHACHFELTGYPWFQAN